MSTATPGTHGDAHGGAHGDAHGHEPVRQEKDTTALGFLIWSAIGIAISTVLCLYIALWLLDSAEAGLGKLASAPPPVPGTWEPAGQPGIIERRMLVERREEKGNGEPQQLLRDQQAQLETYGWTDRQRNLIRIPIDKAMDQVVNAYGQRK